MSESANPRIQISTSSLYVPTITTTDADEPRHILTRRNGPTECGQQLEGEQVAPRAWHRSQLCPRCVQKFIRQVLTVNDWSPL